MIIYDEELKNVALRIRFLRMEKGLSIQELAYRCNIERSNLSRIESGRNNLTLRTMCIICNALEVSLNDLFV